MQTFKFIDKETYFKEISDKISLCSKADTISLSTMDLNDTGLIKPLIQSIIKAGNNGAKVIFCVDAHTFLTDSKFRFGPLFFSKNPQKTKRSPWQQLNATLKNIEAAGVNLVITNKPERRFTVPFTGRSHMKFCAINDLVYIGGCNLSDSKPIDIMGKIKDKKLANKLHNLAKKIFDQKNVSKALQQTDKSIRLNQSTNLYLDAGIKNQSLIYKNALRLIDDAKEYIFMTCQFLPNDQTISKLHQAQKRGVKIKLIYNNPSRQTFPSNFLHGLIRTYEKMIRPADIFKSELKPSDKFIHSKILLSEKELIFGSHNFVNAGVKFGTAEIAIHLKNTSHNHQIINSIKQQIK